MKFEDTDPTCDFRTGECTKCKNEDGEGCGPYNWNPVLEEENLGPSNCGPSTVDRNGA